MLGVALGPRERAAVGLRGIGRGEDERRCVLVVAARPQPLHGAGKRESRAAEALDALAAPADAERLEVGEGVVEPKQVMDSGNLPALIADVRRNKALASLLEQATITDASGEPVDLSSLAPSAFADLAAGASEDDEYDDDEEDDEFDEFDAE